MESCSDIITVSVRYRPGNLHPRPPVKVTVDDGDSFCLSTEGVRRLDLTPGTHDFTMRCRFRKKHLRVDIENPTRITIGFCRTCGGLKTTAKPVSTVDELDYERIGY